MKLNGLILEGTVEVMELNSDNRFPCRATIIMPCCGKIFATYTEFTEDFLEDLGHRSVAIIHTMTDGAEVLLRKHGKCNYCNSELPEKICVELEFKKGE